MKKLMVGVSTLHTFFIPTQKGGTLRVAPFAVLGLLLLMVSAVACVMGSSAVGYADVWALMTGGEVTEGARNILVNVRLPRVAAAVLAGCALAVSGCIIQSVLHNPLASPNVLGINAGSGFAVLLVSSLLPNMVALVPVAAFVGALFTALCIFMISLYAKGSQLSVILAGMAMTALFGAGMNTILIVDPDAYVGSSMFLVGGLAGVQFDDLVWPLVYISLCLVAVVCLMGRLDLLMLGDDVAHSLGVPVTATRIMLLALAALLAGSAVSFAGLLGFVGLIIPHMVRFVVGSKHRLSVPACMMGGALFVVCCDLFSRVAFAPYELPVGITMAFIGAPFFIYLLLRKRGERVD